MPYNLCGLLLLVPVCAYPCSGALPQTDKKDAADEGGKVKVTVVVILATETGDHVDKQVKAIAEEARKLNPALKSFKLKHWAMKSLAPNEKATFNLVDKQSATIVVKHGADNENKVGVAVTAPGQEEIVYRSACGKFLPIITRCQSKSNERVILAIRVQPCNGK